MFFEDCSMQTAEDIDSLNPDERTGLFSTIRKLFWKPYIKIVGLRADRDIRNNSAQSNLPPILPHQIFALCHQRCSQH